MISANKLIFVNHTKVLAIKKALVIPLLMIFFSNIVMQLETVSVVLKNLKIVTRQISVKNRMVSA